MTARLLQGPYARAAPSSCAALDPTASCDLQCWVLRVSALGLTPDTAATLCVATCVPYPVTHVTDTSRYSCTPNLLQYSLPTS